MSRLWLLLFLAGAASAAELHSIDYSSEFDSFELFYRNRWMGPNCRLSVRKLFSTNLCPPGRIPSGGEGSIDIRRIIPLRPPVGPWARYC